MHQKQFGVKEQLLSALAFVFVSQILDGGVDDKRHQ